MCVARYPSTAPLTPTLFLPVYSCSGSKACKKWQFLKRTFLPFVANEIFAQISDKEQSEHDYSFHAAISAFEIQVRVCVVIHEL